jgi:hypothetical protein
MNPRIGSGLKHSRRLLVEKAVEELRKLTDGTRRRSRKPSPERNRETGFWEWTPAADVDGGAFFGKPQERKLNRRHKRKFNGQTMKASGRKAQKGRRWLSQASTKSVGTPADGR